MLLLGIDIGTSSVKVSIVDANNQSVIASAQYPDTEAPIIALQSGWAEQSPNDWWQQTQQALARCNRTGKYNSKDIAAIGIAYQMHGLVLVDKQQNSLRNSIIWCDSRAVAFGERAFETIGKEQCLTHMLNSPGNFTAAKLAWVKQNEPDIYDRIDKVMLPGDYIALKLTGDVTTSPSALSEGIFYDFKESSISSDVLNYFGFEEALFPDVKPVFADHGLVSKQAADLLGITAGIPVAYKAGDQPNNALSLNVLNPGEVAANAGTSGVIYGVSDQLKADKHSRVNTFAHVNHSGDEKRLGVLLCINGTGSFYRWIKNNFGQSYSYQQINAEAAKSPVGSKGLLMLPFGNGAERMLNNKQIGAHIQNIYLNIHTPSDMFRAAQEGIACAFRYGFDIMRETGMNPTVIRAGKTNMFLSEVFTQSFVDVTGVPVELYENDGSVGAALGAGIGAGIFANTKDAFGSQKKIATIEPQDTQGMQEVYQNWKSLLETHLDKV